MFYIYKKAQKETLQKINKEAKELTEELEVSDRKKQIALKQADITAKDQRAQFLN